MHNLLGSTVSWVPLPKVSCFAEAPLQALLQKPCYLFALCLVCLEVGGYSRANEAGDRTLQVFLRSKHGILAACLMCIVF